MALSSASSSLTNLSYIPFHYKNPRFPTTSVPYALLNLTSSSDDSSKRSLRITADSAPKARFIARRKESLSVKQLQRPLSKFLEHPTLFFLLFM